MEMRFRCVVLSIFLGMMFCSPVVGENTPIIATESFELDRQVVIDEILNRWELDDITAYELEVTLPHADDDQLTAAWYAESLNEVKAILAGKNHLSSSALGISDDNVVFDLGDENEDWAFTAVTPCRIVDTRDAGGIISTGGNREFRVHGTAATITAQGGNTAGCLSPVGEPRAVMINVTAIPSDTAGYLKVYPADVSAPTVSLVNFNANSPIANAAVIKTAYLAGNDIEVFAYRSSHVAIDVMGYYVVSGETPVDTFIQTTSTSIAAGANSGGNSGFCPSGYTVTGGGCHWNVYNTSLYIFGSRPFNNQWRCDVHNGTASSRSINVHAICSKIPGR